MTINELIATSSHHAYETGIRSERERIVRIVQELAEYVDGVSTDQTGEMLFVKDLLEYINEADNV